MGTSENPYVIGASHPWFDFIVFVIFVVGFIWIMTESTSGRKW